MTILHTATSALLKNVLFATDFSPGSEAALPYAASLARSYGATFYVVHVVSLSNLQAAAPGADEPVRLAGAKMRELVNSGVPADLRAVQRVEGGDITSVLAQLIQEQKIDLVVAGAHGQLEVEKHTLGPVAEKLFLTADCPLLILGSNADRTRRAGAIEHVLYATDFSATAAYALPYALSLAQEHGGHVTLLHVAPEPGIDSDELSPGSLPYPGPAEVRRSAMRELRHLAAEGTDLWCPTDCVVEFGDPAETIVRVASEQSADIIVLGVFRPKPWSAHVQSSTAYRVVCEAPCPVLTASPHSSP